MKRVLHSLLLTTLVNKEVERYKIAGHYVVNYISGGLQQIQMENHQDIVISKNSSFKDHGKKKLIALKASPKKSINLQGPPTKTPQKQILITESSKTVVRDCQEMRIKR